MIPSETFKPDFHFSLSWGSYTLALMMLLVVIFILAKKHRPLISPKTDCKLIEKTALSHKTMVYIIEHQQQRFLLADNQQSLAIHPLTPVTQDDSDV